MSYAAANMNVHKSLCYDVFSSFNIPTNVLAGLNTVPSFYFLTNLCADFQGDHASLHSHWQGSWVPHSPQPCQLLLLFDLLMIIFFLEYQSCLNLHLFNDQQCFQIQANFPLLALSFHPGYEPIGQGHPQSRRSFPSGASLHANHLWLLTPQTYPELCFTNLLGVY